MDRTKVNEVFTKEDWGEYDKYVEILNEKLVKSGLSEKEQEKMFNQMAYNMQMVMCANRIAEEANELIAQQKKLNNQYINEPDDAKARKIAEKHQKLQEKIDKLKSERGYFLNKFYNSNAKAKEYENKLNEILTKKGYELQSTKRSKANRISHLSSLEIDRSTNR